MPGVEQDGFAHSPHSISLALISIRDQLIKKPIYHLLHSVCCSEARGLRLGCWEHIILRITDSIQHIIAVFVDGTARAIVVAVAAAAAAAASVVGNGEYYLHP